MQESWIIPCKISYFNVIEHFKENNIVVWKNVFTIKAGDEVYIYVGAPYGEIRYKCEVIEEVTDETELQEHKYAIVTQNTNDYILKNTKYVKMKLTMEYPEKFLSLAKLKEHGLGQVQLQARVPRQLYPYLKEKERKLREE